MTSSKASESGSPVAPGTWGESSLPPGSSGPQALPQSLGRKGGKRWRLALWIFVCVEVGLFLLLVPWSPLWTQNLLLGYYPPLRPFYLNAYVRGAISGLGLINLWFGFWEAWNFRPPPKAVNSE